jgi:uncharacterized protein (TIGR02118 family)
MIKVAVLYPNTEGSKFDMDYYLNKHTPMVKQKLGSALKSVAIEAGLAGAAPGTQPTYRVLCHLGFDSVDSFNTAFAPHAQAIMGDIPNYTDVQPVVQIGEVKV